MAGTIIADYIRADANKISLNVGNTVIASINASGILSNTGSVMIAPNGTVNGASISANTIVGSQIQANTITGSLIQTGTITYDKMAITGEVIQAVGTYTNFVTLSTTTPTDIVTLNITTKKANSKLFVTFAGDCNADTAGAWKVFGVWINGVEKTKHITSVATASYQDSCATTYLSDALALGTHTVAIKSYNGAGTSTWSESGTNNLVVMEVSA